MAYILVYEMHGDARFSHDGKQYSTFEFHDRTVGKDDGLNNVRDEDGWVFPRIDSLAISLPSQGSGL